MERLATWEVIRGLQTKSDKIRALASAGYERVEIARHLGISYQHVRNVLVNSRVAPEASQMRPRKRIENRIETSPLRIEFLASRGFTLLAEWARDGEGINASKDIPQKRGVYAFVVDGVVRYIGVAKQDLRRRLYGYAKPGADQKTNLRIQLLIVEALTSGGSVKIWTASPDDLHWNELPVDQTVGLEAGLIRRFKPAWNKQGTTLRDVTLDEL